MKATGYFVWGSNSSNQQWRQMISGWKTDADDGEMERDWTSIRPILPFQPLPSPVHLPLSLAKRNHLNSSQVTTSILTSTGIEINIRFGNMFSEWQHGCWIVPSAMVNNNATVRRPSHVSEYRLKG